MEKTQSHSKQGKVAFTILTHGKNSIRLKIYIKVYTQVSQETDEKLLKK